MFLLTDHELTEILRAVNAPGEKIIYNEII